MQTSQKTADIIKLLAKKNKISISKLLEDCNLNKNSLYTMQSSGYFPRVEALTKIADYFNCSVDYLLGRTDMIEINGQTLCNISIDEAKEDPAFYNELKRCSNICNISEDEALKRINKVNSYFATSEKNYKDMLDLIIKLDNTAKFETKIEIEKTAQGIIKSLKLNFPIITGESSTEGGTASSDETNEYNRNLAAYLEWYNREKTNLKDSDYKSNLLGKLLFFNFFDKIE